MMFKLFFNDLKRLFSDIIYKKDGDNVKRRYLLCLIPLVVLSSCSKKIESSLPEESLDEDTIKERQSFDDYCNNFFLNYLGNNAYYWNVYTINPETFGYERPEDYKASFTRYYETSPEDMEETYNAYSEEYAIFTSYNYDKLSFNQKISYDYIASFFEKEIEYYNPANGFDDYLDLNYIDSNGGNVADFDSMIKGYHINTTYDLIDMNSYIESTSVSFDSYFDYAKDKIEKGYALSDKTIDGMTSFLDDISSQGDDYYLFSLIEDKINSSSVSTEDKSYYLPLIEESLKNNYLPAVSSLSANLKTIKGSLAKEDEGYYAKYGSKAKQMYKYNLECALGYSNINVEDYIKELDEGIDSYLNSIDQLVIKLGSLSTSERNNFLKYLNGDLKLSNEADPNKILEYLKEFAKTIVPELKSNPEIDFSYMDDAVAKITNTVAYYTKSPIDSNLKEYITLNGRYLSDTDDLITTIAHEGYPGHLYEYVYLKELNISNIATIMTNTGHAEGWACYVEEKLYDYLASKSSSKAYKLYCEYSKYNFLLSYALYARVDAGINYEGWTISKVSNYLKENDFNSDAAQTLFDLLIEMPTGYAPYGYGSLKMHKYHSNAKNKLKSKYDEIKFNSLILSHGWSGYETLDKLVSNYLK